MEATAQGFWQPEQAELTASYVARYFAEMPRGRRRGVRPGCAERLGGGGLPALRGGALDPASWRRALLRRDDLAPEPAPRGDRRRRRLRPRPGRPRAVRWIAAYGY